MNSRLLAGVALAISIVTAGTAQAVEPYLDFVRGLREQQYFDYAILYLDQIAAKELGKYTQLSSLELGLEPQPLAGNCDSGYTCAYMSMSWRGPTSPLPAEINPRAVFERLFGDGDSTDARAKR